MSEDIHYRRGDPVMISPLGRAGVVQERLNAGLYRVAVGDLLICCRGAELKRQAANPGPERKRSAVCFERSPRNRPASGEIDLHGLRVQEALARTAQAINEAVLDERWQLDIIHGIGEGKIRRALHEYLPTLTVVRRFAADPLNPGVTKVLLNVRSGR